MKKNEPTAADRVACPIPVYDADGKLKKNLTFLTASGEVFYLRGSDNTWQAAANDAVEIGGANTTGTYKVQLSQAETNYDTIVGIKLVKAGYDDHFWFEKISPPDSVTASAVWDAMRGDHNTPGSFGEMLRLDAPGEGIHVPPNSVVITDGTETNTVADTIEENWVFHQITDAATDIDFKYVFERTNGIGSYVHWVGFLAGPGVTVNVFAYNWTALAWEQIGVVWGIDDTNVSSENIPRRTWALSEDHTDPDGIVEIRFQQSVINSDIYTERILVGYAPEQIDANLVSCEDGAIHKDAFTADAQRQLFGVLWEGGLSAFADGQATLSGGTFDDHVLRGQLLQWLYHDAASLPLSWIIADNIGNVCTLVGGDAWPVEPDVGGEGSTFQIRSLHSVAGAMYDRGGASRTNMRQQVNGLADVHLNTGVNIGQPDTGNPAIAKDEAGTGDTLTWDVPEVDGARTTTWVKGAP